MDEKEYGVHTSHCCVKHGCKYGEPDCPVVNKTIKQEYICEYCEDEGIISLDELYNSIDIMETTNKLFDKIEKWEGSNGYLIEEEDYINYKNILLQHLKRYSNVPLP